MQVLAWLRTCAPDVLVHHSPNEGRRTRWEGQRMQALGTRAGWPDLELLYQGELAFIELKAEGGRLTDRQQQCIADIEAAGHLVAVCRSLQDVVDLLHMMGWPTRERPPDAAQHVERHEGDR